MVIIDKLSISNHILFGEKKREQNPVRLSGNRNLTPKITPKIHGPLKTVKNLWLAENAI